MQTIHALCNPLNIAIIEDAAHALGGNYNDKPIGSCEFSDMAVLSFHPVKSITTAEGGAVMTNSEHLAKQCLLFAKHGITRDTELMQGDSQGPWYYQQLVLGYNYRLSDLHAALGISQLARIDSFIEERRRLAGIYFDKLVGLPLLLPQTSSLDDSSWHLFMVTLTQHDRKAVFESLHAQGIGANVHYIPIHHHPYYKQLGFAPEQFPASVNFYQNALTLPLYVGLTENEQNKVIAVLHEILA
jgi:dTDP-4-amino-4,6-dideoxygalactose transaminase